MLVRVDDVSVQVDVETSDRGSSLFCSLSMVDAGDVGRVGVSLLCANTVKSD